MSKKITSIGGQALMEGIMMVGPHSTVAAFCSEKGEISTEEIECPRLTQKYPLLGKPFIRGIFALIDSFRLGYKALSLSADKITEDVGEEELSGLDKWLDEHLGEKMTGIIMGVASVLGVGLAILLFFLLPTVLFNLLQGAVPGDISGWRSLFEGGLRIAILWDIFCWFPCCRISSAPSSIMERSIKPFSAMKTICPLRWKREKAGQVPPPLRHQLSHSHAAAGRGSGVLYPLYKSHSAHPYKAFVHSGDHEHRL